MKTTLFCLLCLLVAASSSADVTVDHDKTADFSKYASFAIEAATPAADPLMRERMIEAIAEGLAARGLERAAEGADLEVVIHASSDEELRVTANDWSYGGYRGWRGWRAWGPTTVNVGYVAVGTLMIDMLDAASQKLVWRGIATETLPRKPAKLEKRIRRAVDRLFRAFPPGQ